MLLIAALVVAAGQFGIGHAAEIERALPPPTGQNGYEDYVRAAILVSFRNFYVYEGNYGGTDPSTPPTPEDVAIADLDARLRGMPYLDVKREELEKFGAALDLVRAGSAKPVYDPRKNFGPDTILPELSYFKALSRLFTAESYVRFADGDSLGGTRSIMDSLAFNYHISGGSLIASLVGVAGSAIAFRNFEPRLSSLSLTDCREIVTMSDQILAAPMGLKAGLEIERKSEVSLVNQVFQWGGGAATLSKLMEDINGSSTTLPKEVESTLQSAQPSDLARWSQEAAAAINDIFGTFEGMLDLPERQWVGADDAADLIQKQQPTVVAAFVGIVSPTMDQAFSAIARQRTQLRLLGLHGKIIEYRWMHNKLPGKLQDAADQAACQDPLTGREFGYTRKGDGYRLFSYGSKATGEIELNYHPPLSENSEKSPP